MSSATMTGLFVSGCQHAVLSWSCIAMWHIERWAVERYAPRDGVNLACKHGCITISLGKIIEMGYAMQRQTHHSAQNCLHSPSVSGRQLWSVIHPHLGVGDLFYFWKLELTGAILGGVLACRRGWCVAGDDVVVVRAGVEAGCKVAAVVVLGLRGGLRGDTGDEGEEVGKGEVANDDDDDRAGVWGSGSCEAICCCWASSAGRRNDVEDAAGSCSSGRLLLIVDAVPGLLSLLERTNRSTSDGRALSVGRKPSMVGEGLQSVGAVKGR